MTLGFYIGWVVGCLTILAIAPWRKSTPTISAHTVNVIGSDVSVPRAVVTKDGSR